MIPLSLSVRNFLCYGEEAPTLYLEGIHTACLCGPNGHGKSSLLDAMTWVLWGEARGRAQDELIHQGQREMQVALELEARGQRYRVQRRHARVGRGRQGVTNLDLQVASGGGFRSLNGNSVRETEARIRDILSMDYQTFVNSAFLRQGEADLFTKAGPADRKRVLAEILNLSLYDRLEGRAKARAGEREAAIQRMAGELEWMWGEVAQRPHYQGQLEQVEEELASLQRRLEPQEEQVRGLWETLQYLTGRQTRLGEVLTVFNQLSGERAQLEGAIQREGERLAWEARALEQRVAEAEARVRRGQEARQELDRVGAQLQALEAGEEGARRQREELSELAGQVQHTRGELERVEKEGREMADKLRLLHAAAHTDTHCPLCNTQLGEVGRRNLATSYQAQIQERRQLYQRSQAALRELEQRQQALKGALDRAEADLTRKRAQLQETKAAQEHLVHEGVAAQAELAQARERLGVLGQHLAEEAYAQEERRRLAQVRERLAQVQQEREALETEVRPLAQLQARYQQAREERDALAQQREPLAARRHALQAQVERCHQLEREVKEKERAQAQLGSEKGLYNDLATAFGKGGIQALIIEAAVPELEAEANALLSRLSDGRLSLKLETQRERRSGRGDPVETLEIKTADELGTRSYEMFSGGEAFRINFALRIALSKLLARRSGAPLPTLFIDEGFGTQDTAGRERLVEAIRSIQDDFQRIIVITHIDELKDAFPVRVEVTKTERGSTFWIT